MTKNCLVKNYKKVVDNNNLEVYGGLRIKVHGSSSSNNEVGITWNVVPYPNDRAKTVDGTAKLSTVSKSESLVSTIGSGSGAFYCADGEYDFYVNDVYKITKLTLGNNNDSVLELNLDKLKYNALTRLNVYRSKYTKGDLGGIDLTAADIIRVDTGAGVKNNVTGDIGTFVFNSATQLNVMGTKVSGNIETMVAPNLTQLTISGTEVTGDVKVWANAMRLAGRTSGTCIVSYRNALGEAPILWDGSAITSVHGNFTITFAADGVSMVTD